MRADNLTGRIRVRNVDANGVLPHRLVGACHPSPKFTSVRSFTNDLADSVAAPAELRAGSTPHK